MSAQLLPRLTSSSPTITVRSGTLFRELRLLRKWQATGELYVSFGEARMCVILDKGKPVFARGGESLGRRLLRQHRITLGQCIEAEGDASKRSADDPDTAFGDAAVLRGFLGAEEKANVLCDLVLERILHCLSGEHPVTRFSPEARPPFLSAQYVPPLEQLFLRAARSLEPRRLDRVLELAEERYCRLAESADSLARAFSLNTAEAQFLATIDGCRSTHALLEAPLEDGTDPAAILATLVLTGLMDLLPCPTSVRGGAAAPRSERVLKRVSSGPPQRRTSELIMPSATAAQAFERGRGELRRFAFRKALAHLRCASGLVPGNLVYAVYAKWAEFRFAGLGASTPLGSEIKILATQAIERDTQFGFGYYVLGQLALLDGDEEMARTLLGNTPASSIP